MSENSETPNSTPQSLPSSSSTSTKKERLGPEISNNGRIHSGQKISYPNPPDPTNPDPATLREQWRYAIRQYSRWYSHAWGTAILAGLSFFALGWIIKGSNPLPSFKSDSGSGTDQPSSSDRRDDRK